MLTKGFKLGACLFFAAVSVAACSRGEQQKYAMHPFVERAANDTSCVENRILSSYSDDNRDGSIAIIGEGADVIRIADYFSVYDSYDNINAAHVPDGIPDFAGEVFDVLIDDANGPYGGYAKADNSLFLRELIIRNAVAMLDGKCYANAYDKSCSAVKAPAKALVIPSVSYSPEVISDLDTLLNGAGVRIPVVYPPLSSVRTVFDMFKDISGIGVMAGLEVAASGVYGELFRDISALSGYRSQVHNVIYSPQGLTPGEKVRNFIQMYINSGYTQPLNAVIIDDLMLARDIDSMYAALDSIVTEKSEEAALYESVIAEGFRFIDPAECMASELFRQMRDANDMALRISYPKCNFFITVFSPEFMIESGKDSIGDALKYARAYDAGQNTVKIVHMTRRHVNSRELAELDSIAPNLHVNF